MKSVIHNQGIVYLNTQSNKEKMKTQINTLVSGSTHLGATGVAGTNSAIRQSIASKVISENKDSLTVIIRGYQIDLTAHWSVSGKTVTYSGNCPLELYNSFFGNFGLPKENPSATVIINMDMTANLQTNSKKGFYNKISESEITIK